MELLTLDRGNSTLDVRLAGAGRRERLAPGPDLVDRLDAWLGSDRPTVAVAVSVVPGGLDAVRALLARLGIPLRVAGRDLPCPLATRYADPATLGADRWVGGLAAVRRHGDAVVVDCGTAVTVNAVRAAGPLFVGGAIGLGLSSAAAALAARAPALPAWDRCPPTAMPAIDSPDAVRAGLALAFAGGVLALVDRAAAAMGPGPVARVLTGGDGPLVRAALAALDADAAARFLDAPALIHDGLEILWREFGPKS